MSCLDPKLIYDGPMATMEYKRGISFLSAILPLDIDLIIEILEKANKLKLTKVYSAFDVVKFIEIYDLDLASETRHEFLRKDIITLVSERAVTIKYVRPQISYYPMPTPTIKPVPPPPRQIRNHKELKLVFVEYTEPAYSVRGHYEMK